MWSRDLNQTGSRIVLLIGQFIVLIFCIAYIQHTYTANILPDKLVKETFQEISCFLISKKLSTRGHLIHTYRADFLVSYNVQGIQYNRWVSGNGLDMSFFDNDTQQEDILSQYDIGQSYTCYYDPSNPQVAILVLRHNWLSTFPLMVPSVIFILVAYFFVVNLLQLLPRIRKSNNQ